MNVICVVDDDESVRTATGALLRSAGFVAQTFDSARRFLEFGPIRDFGCLILDLRMPGMSGLELQRILNAQNSTGPIIFISALDDSLSRQKAIGAGAVGFLSKPFDGDTLLAAVTWAIYQRQLDTAQADRLKERQYIRFRAALPRSQQLAARLRETRVEKIAAFDGSEKNGSQVCRWRAACVNAEA